MLKKFSKRIIRKIAWKKKKKTINQILQSRCRQDRLPENGRFTPRDIEQIILQTESNIEELMPSFKDITNVGNYQNAYIGLLDLAIYRSLIGHNVARDYAMSLVGDMMWLVYLNAKGLIPIIDPLRRKLMELKTKDPMEILGKRLKSVMKYPYGEPGYKIDFHLDNNAYCMDIYSCPVFDFYKQFGDEEMNLFRKTWCTFDYSAAEYFIEGGKYEREHALSDEDKVCDMRWSIEK